MADVPPLRGDVSPAPPRGDVPPAPPRGDALAIDFVSPLPPVRSGIADYSADLLPHLEKLCDLRVVSLEGQPASPATAARWQLVAPERLGEDGRLPLY